MMLKSDDHTDDAPKTMYQTLAVQAIIDILRRAEWHLLLTCVLHRSTEMDYKYHTSITTHIILLYITHQENERLSGFVLWISEKRTREVKRICHQSAKSLNHTAEDTETDNVNMCGPVGLAKQTAVCDGMGHRPSENKKKQKEKQPTEIATASNSWWKATWSQPSS